MSKIARGWWIVPAVLTACSASPAPEPPSPPVVTLSAVSPAPPDAGGESAEPEPLRVASSPCLNGPAGIRCDGIVDRREAKALPGEIQAAREAMIRTAFKDVHAVVTLSRLALRRDSERGTPTERTTRRAPSAGRRPRWRWTMRPPRPGSR
jgi:hypothetical protein